MPHGRRRDPDPGRNRENENERRASRTSCSAFDRESVRRTTAVGPQGGPMPPPRSGSTESSYLVDPASSHMLVSKIKPCMSKHKL